MTAANLPRHNHTMPAGANVATTGFTPSGSQTVFDQREPQLALNFLINTNGYDPATNDRRSLEEDEVMVKENKTRKLSNIWSYAGEIIIMPYSIVPTNSLWSVCDGTSLTTAAYSTLFNAIGKLVGR